MSIDTHDFQLKYDGIVLMIHLYIRANQDISKLQRNVVRAAKGPRLDACVAWTKTYTPGQPLTGEGEMLGPHRTLIEAFLQQSDQVVVVFQLCVNTDTDPKKLCENITRAARGPRLDDLISAVVKYEGENGGKVWEGIQRIVQQASTDAYPGACSKSACRGHALNKE